MYCFDAAHGRPWLIMLALACACTGEQPVGPGRPLTSYLGAFPDMPTAHESRAGLTIVSTPAGIAFEGGAGGQYGTRFLRGSVVELQAAAGAQTRFEGWSGDDCEGIGSCTVHLDEPEHLVVAHFTPLLPAPPYLLILHARRLYTGSPAPDTLGEVAVQVGSEVVVRCTSLKTEVPLLSCSNGTRGVVTFADTTDVMVTFIPRPGVTFRRWYFPSCKPAELTCGLRVGRSAYLLGRMDIELAPRPE